MTVNPFTLGIFCLFIPIIRGCTEGQICLFVWWDKLGCQHTERRLMAFQAVQSTAGSDSDSLIPPGTAALRSGFDVVLFCPLQGFRVHWERFRSGAFCLPTSVGTLSWTFVLPPRVSSFFFVCFNCIYYWYMIGSGCFILKIYWTRRAVPVSDFRSSSICSEQLDVASVKHGPGTYFQRRAASETPRGASGRSKSGTWHSRARWTLQGKQLKRSQSDAERRITLLPWTCFTLKYLKHASDSVTGGSSLCLWSDCRVDSSCFKLLTKAFTTKIQFLL